MADHPYELSPPPSLPPLSHSLTRRRIHYPTPWALTDATPPPPTIPHLDLTDRSLSLSVSLIFSLSLSLSLSRARTFSLSRSLSPSLSPSLISTYNGHA